MADVKVLVVDDSLTMRVLISGALERIKGVQVVGAADGAAEARKMVDQYRPEVMTLDVEMPGMSGLEYLAEIMEERPMPVIMFSTRTAAGAAESVEALRLGAIDCFPKPKVAVQAELDAIIGKLGKRIKSARNADLKRGKAAKSRKGPVADINWNGRLLAIGADAANTQALFDLFQNFPANCPPTLVVQQMSPGLLTPMIEQLREQIAPKVVEATDGMKVEQGTIYFAPQGDTHMVVDTWPNGTLRLLAREPVAGERPSISLLFASVAKAAGGNGLGVLLALDDEDGSAGLRAMLAGGAYAIGRNGTDFTLNKGAVSQPVAGDAIFANIVKLCSK
ncbi:MULTISPECIES: chemotaxis protein CheB [Sphingomonas]|jgi:two-component system chemotaxis response regulator CheB|uniref:protein-glutamate methylesterase n=1 Tax=Sphingomonas yabuuchiae TaxID=172044 RepID=A0AA41A0Y2_9SPHN|nr:MULTISPECIES: chemotaxis protein CheB [Sphingomonas]KQO51289.1 response regulator [Sphingomonas sp. Leaf257]MBB4609681.1 two-component system chemotaxis response regulator CheB [Sphingomonas yabuuchiae]MBN3557993.1 response regulator [Sphingomonas yabuuchiae]